MMSVEYASMTSGTNGVTPVETPVSVPASLGAVGYAAFALLQAIPLSQIVPFSMVVSAFEAEGGQQVLAPAPVPAPAPEPPPIVAAYTPPAPPVLDPIAYTEGGYRPEPGPAIWGRGAPVLASAVSVPQDWSPPVEAVPLEAAPLGEGYAANRPADDRKARQVLDELSFLFDGN